MPPRHPSIRTALILAIAAGTCAPAAGAGAAQHPRSPDIRGVATTIVVTPAAHGRGQDLRTPDARDAASPTQDLRSPDTRDLSQRLAARPASRPVRVIRVTPDGFDWADAAIGAGATLGALLLAAGAATGMSRRRMQPPPITNA